MFTSVRRLPKIGFKVGDRVYLVGLTKRDEERPVEILSVRHEPRWSLGMNGRHEADHAIYQIRVIETGEEFPADERGLNRYPRPKKKGRD